MLSTKKPSTSKKASVFFNFSKGITCPAVTYPWIRYCVRYYRWTFTKGTLLKTYLFFFSFVGITFTQLLIYEKNRKFPIVSGEESTCSLTQAIDFSFSLIVLPFLYGFFFFFFSNERFMIYNIKDFLREFQIFRSY